MFILKTLTKKLLKLQILLFLTAKETFLDNLTTIKFKSIQNFAIIMNFSFWDRATQQSEGQEVVISGYSSPKIVNFWRFSSIFGHFN